MKKQGFTLIELLVVIAIIGILSSVVLASLNSARNKGKDASAKGSLSSVRASAEIFYNGTGANSYLNVCTDPDVDKLLDAAVVQTGKTANCDFTASTGLEYAAEIELLSSKFFCVDSSGYSGELAATKGAATTVCVTP